MVCTGYFKPEWYRNYPQIQSGGRFLNILGPKKIRENICSLQMTFLKRIIQNRSDNPTLIWSIESI